MFIISVKQVPETPTYAVLLIYGEIDSKREEKCSGERTGEGLRVSLLGVVYRLHFR